MSEPDKVGKIKVETMCLEHGKDDPNPRMKYEIRPVESLTKDPRVIELCKMLGRGEVPQNSAQAAAWHLANGLSWQELAAKDRYHSQFTGTSQKFFSQLEIDLAMRIAGAAVERAEEAKSTSPAKSRSIKNRRERLSLVASNPQFARLKSMGVVPAVLRRPFLFRTAGSSFCASARSQPRTTWIARILVV